MGGIAGCRCYPRANGTGFADALFEYLPIQRLPIAQDGANVLRLIMLTDAGIDTDLLEEICHPECPSFVCHNGNYSSPQDRIF
ncbi:hypothetical protein D3C80_1706090 [compost metagenome]